jgi:drug/metabolite transporter (DMT)-like permease
VAVVLVLLSAFLHAAWNALLKRERDKDAAGAVVLAVAAAVAAIAALIAALAGPGVPFADRSALGFAVAAGLFEAGYFITLVLALARGPLGLVYTVSRGGAILLVWPVSVLWLHEPVTTPVVAGSLVLAGGLLLGPILGAVGFPRSARARLAGLERGGDPRSVRLACLCGAFIAAYHLCYKRAMAAESSAAAVFAVALAVALPINLARLGGAARRQLPGVLARRPGPLLLAGALCAASFLIFLVALRDVGAGLVLTLRNSSILFAVLLGWLLGEPTSRRDLAGALLVACGAALLSLPR